MDSKREPQVLQGLGASPGVAIGRAVCLSIHHLEVYRIPIPETEVEAEVGRLKDATRQARVELRDRCRVAVESTSSPARTTRCGADR